jgi:hypothetical protein
LLYTLTELNFSTRIIKLISSFLLQRKFRVSVEGEMSTPRCIQAEVHKVLSCPSLYTTCKLMIPPPPTIGVNLALFTDDTSLYATEHKEGYVLRKVQRGLNSMLAWCERWINKINEDKTRAIYFSHQRRPPDSLLTLNGRNIPFVNSVKYLGVIFDKRMTWRLHI